MKQLLTLLTILSFGLSFAQTTLIPNANFEQALIDKGFDTGAVDGSVPTANIDTLTYLDLNFFFSISDFFYSRRQERFVVFISLSIFNRLFYSF